jgi:hypothetical protein
MEEDREHQRLDNSSSPSLAVAVAAVPGSVSASSPAADPQSVLRQQAHSPTAPGGLSSRSNRLPPTPSPPARMLSWNSSNAAAATTSSTTAVSQRNSIEDEPQRVRIYQQPQQPAHNDSIIPERETEDDQEFLLSSDNLLDQVSTLTGWSEVQVSQEPGGGHSVPPSPRSLHAAAVLNGVMYVFGGYDGSQRVNTFHAFSFAEKRWSPVLPSAHSAPPPSPRDRHAAFVFGNSFYVHGGFDGRSRVADMYGFDFSTMTWRVIDTSSSAGRVPSARHSHSAVVHGHSLYIAFGYDGSYKSDIHEYDFVQSRWSAVPAAGRRPRARYRATAAVHKKYMIVYGGHDGVRHLSDTSIFDLECKTWSSLITEGPSPVPRDSHVSVVHGSSMFVFAGSSGSAMNDFQELQLPSSMTTCARWRPVHTSSRGFQPRHRFCHAGVVHDGSLFCFGGYDGRERLNDFVRFDFSVYDLSFEVPPSTIIADFRAMINDSTLSDVTFLVEGQPVYAHKLMLMRCSYFEALFLGQMKESRMSEIPISQVSHPIFLAIIEYLYTDQIKIPLSAAMEVFEAADLFCVPRLKTMCEKRMLQSITVDNAAAIFHSADMHSATALRQKAKKFILSHFEEVSKSSCFEEMGRNNIDLVFELLQSR